MAEHQVLPSESAARRLPAPAEADVLRRLLSSPAFAPGPAGLRFVEAEAETDAVAGAPHCRHAMYYVD
jgi:hypothetical protein